jgi:pimeloyl-ACP methyl ester carboxylesterase
VAESADTVEDLVAYLGLRSVRLVVHDYGGIVGQELLDRANRGNLPFARVRSALDTVRGASLSDNEFDDLWLGMSKDNGHKLSHLLIMYNAERAIHHRRWESALADSTRPLHLVWGLDDPVSGGRVLKQAVKVLPRATVTELPGVGHYPSSEAPQAVAAAVRNRP